MSAIDWVCKKISLESTAFGHYDLLSTSKLDACANVTTCCLNPVHLNRQINFSVAKENKRSKHFKNIGIVADMYSFRNNAIFRK